MRKRFMCWLMVIMMLPGVASAQILPATKVQRAVAALIEKNMTRRGFASNDPRWAATLRNTGSGIAGAAAAAAVVTAAGITAPAWVTAAAIAGLGALFAVGIDLAVDATLKWIQGPDGSVTLKGVSGGTYVPLPGQEWIWIGGYPAGQGFPLDSNKGSEGACNAYWGKPNSLYIVVSSSAYSCLLRMKPEYQPAADSSQSMLNIGTINNSVDPNYVPDGSGSMTGSPTQAVASLSDADRAKPVNPELIAKIADAAMQKAASTPGYEGVPYDAADPITIQDAISYRQASPDAWPTVGDITSPQVAPSTSPGASPWALPNSASEPVAPPTGANPTPPISAPTFDWSIPNFGSSIEKQTVPVSYVPTVFAAPTGCPSPITFTMFGKSYSIGYGPFCDLMATLAPIFLACGAAAAALIFAESLKS
ncbi:virulence factor TspB C-terminal domain-related protein [Pseudoduganella sp. S-14]|uniref:virulence factor TspB C-terminal domain-related protein n=1 Tax=Pseudoduganella sp. S-14 TaxID=3404065 RepID=UPI003CF735DF